MARKCPNCGHALAQANLTPKARELLGLIRSNIEIHNTAPSYERMMTMLGLKSKSGIHRLVGQLEERGYVSRQRCGRDSAGRQRVLPHSIALVGVPA